MTQNAAAYLCHLPILDPYGIGKELYVSSKRSQLAGTWEEKSVNKWANDRIKELLISAGSQEFSGGRAEVAEVTRCSGDAFLVIVRNKKCVGYTYELTIKEEGEWLVGTEKEVVKGHLDIPKFSFGELDGLQIEVKLNEDEDLEKQDKHRVKPGKVASV